MAEPNYERIIDPEGVLCYVEGNRAFFTTQELSKQWGDDWDDAPYEHNAERPYGPRCYYKKTGVEKDPADWNPDGTPKWHVFFVFFDADFDVPSEGHGNIPYSVQGINNGDVAWLRPSRYNDWKGVHPKAIQAGIQYRYFVKAIEESGGCVYEPKTEE